MSDLEFSVGFDELRVLDARLKEIGNQAPHIIRRAINWTGDKARTQVVRTLVKQTGAKYGVVRKSLLTRRATFGRLAYRLVAFGGFLSLKEFSPRQRKDGVSAAPWGRRTLFLHAFIAPSMGGHIFVREIHSGRRVGRLPVRELWGPAIPRELLKGATKETFEATVKANLVPRAEHELLAMMGGFAPRG